MIFNEDRFISLIEISARTVRHVLDLCDVITSPWVQVLHLTKLSRTQIKITINGN